MKKEDLIKRVEKERKTYTKSHLEYSEQKEVCESLECDSKAVKRMEKESKKLEKVRSKFENDKMLYSKAIYEFLSIEKPNLVIRATGETILWGEGFGSEYESLPSDQIRALIPLVEGGGGRYRLVFE